MHCQTLLLFAVILFATCCQARAADTHVLAAARQAGDLTRVKISLEVGGELKVVDDGKVKPLKMSVVGSMAYDEQVLAAEDQRLSSVRYYDQAEAVIKIEKGGAKPVLPASRRLICADWGSQTVLLVHPEAPLTREQLDLISLPADSLVIDALLPDEPVAQGESWKHAEPLMATLLRLDAVSSSDAKSILKEVIAGQAATAEISGKVEGAVDGVSTSLEIKGRYTYDFGQRRITKLVLLIKEQRSVGHVATGLDVVSKLDISVSEVQQSTHLTRETLDRVTFDSDPLRRLLTYESMPGGFRLLHDRRWHAVSDDPKLLTMRFVDRGDLLAQCNVSSLTKAAPGQHVTLTKFQTEIQQALGDKFGQFLKASEESDARGWTIYRVIASGTVAELPIIWHYYLVADQEGHQIAFAFTLEEGLAARFAEADRALVDAIGFIELPIESAALPSSVRFQVPSPAPQAASTPSTPPTPARAAPLPRSRASAPKPVETPMASKSPIASKSAAHESGPKSTVRFRN